MNEPGPFNEAQAARILGVASRTLRRWRQGGAIGYSLTPGGRIRYTGEDILRLQRAMRVPPSAGHT